MLSFNDVSIYEDKHTLHYRSLSCAPQTYKVNKCLNFAILYGLSKNCPRNCWLKATSPNRIWTFRRFNFWTPTYTSSVQRPNSDAYYTSNGWGKSARSHLYRLRCSPLFCILGVAGGNGILLKFGVWLGTNIATGSALSSGGSRNSDKLCYRARLFLTLGQKSCHIQQNTAFLLSLTRCSCHWHW